ncbi:MAG: hypothetical protein ACFFCW_38485 [Candidatus Hodarchaeota archaeon]
MEVIWWVVGNITASPWALFLLAVGIFAAGYWIGRDGGFAKLSWRKGFTIQPRKKDDTR